MKKIENPWLGREGYNCFGCCPTNEYGLKMEFWEQDDEVVSLWRPRPEYQSWVDTLHGGIQAALVDEIAGWALFAKTGLNGVTAKLEMRYRKPVVITEEPLTLHAHIVEFRGRIAEIAVELYNPQGEECTTALLTYMVDRTKK